MPERQISKTLEEGTSVKEDGAATKRPARYLEDDESLEVGLDLPSSPLNKTLVTCYVSFLIDPTKISKRDW